MVIFLDENSEHLSKAQFALIGVEAHLYVYLEKSGIGKNGNRIDSTR